MKTRRWTSMLAGALLLLPVAVPVPGWAQGSPAATSDLPRVVNRMDMLRKSQDQLYTEAVALIDTDSGPQLVVARAYLDHLLNIDPHSARARIELARHAMKTNWSAQGVKQAEDHLLAVRAQEPRNANGHVLLGYVFAHQRRYAEAETELSAAAEIGTPNLWLWTNWGELRSMQGKDGEAIDKYMNALAGSRTFGPNDLARRSAYWGLLRLYERGGQYARMDALHRQRLAEFDEVPCFHYEYARFRGQYFPEQPVAAARPRNPREGSC